MKTAVIFARYSSDSQSEQSIDGQLRVCEEYAKNNDDCCHDFSVPRFLFLMQEKPQVRPVLFFCSFS